jgi:hypothetical protein
MTLLVLLAVEGVTIPAIRLLLLPHIFVGLLLLPPLALKMSSTGYRFVRYYSGDREYRTAGPPRPIPRIIAPFLVLSTVALFGSGIALLVVGPDTGEYWKRIHTLSFILWFGFMTVHVLVHLIRAVSLSSADLLPKRFPSVRRDVAGALTRRSLVAGSLILGIVLAIIMIPLDAHWIKWVSGLGVDG